MSTTAARTRRAHLVDTIGVLAVVAGLVLGLLPGMTPSAQAEITDDCDTHPNFSLERVILEIEEVGGTQSYTLDSDDDYLECVPVKNRLRLKFVDDIDDASPLNAFEGLRLYTQQNLNDNPDFHVSCSITYTGTQLSIGPWGEAGSTVFRITRATLYSLTSSGAWKVSGDCVEPQARASVHKVDAEGNGLAGAEFTLHLQGTSTKATTEHANPCTTDTNGRCDFGEVAPGDYTMTETGVPDGYRLATPSSQDFTLQPEEAATRTFTDPRIPYTITVEPDGRNAVGNTHGFTVTLTDDLGAVTGADVDLAWTGVGSIQSISPTGPDATSCTTDGDGQCAVVVQSDDAGSGSLTATFDTPYQNTVGAAPGNTTVVDGVPATAPYSAISDGANKTWVGYEVEIGTSATNLLGDPHPFTVTVWEVDGTVEDGEEDRGPGVDGKLVDDVTVDVDWDGPTGSTIDGTTCVTGEGGTTGECGFLVDSPEDPGMGTITVRKLTGTIEAILGQDDESLTVDLPAAGADGAVSATKIWREYRALLDDDSVNPVSSAHTFDVQVQYRETSQDNWTNAGSGLVVTWDSPDGVGQVVQDDDDVDGVTGSTCDEGTAEDGTCTIVVYSDATGDRSVTVLSVKGDLLPGDDDVAGSDELEYTFRDVAYASQPANADQTATKTWLDFGATIEATGHNQVGEPHTFTIEVFRNGGPDTEPDVPDGTQVATEITWHHPDASNEVVSNTCVGQDAGTVADECSITLNSGAAGMATVKVIGLDDHDFDGVTQDFTFSTQPTASKTWYAYRAWIEESDTNRVGDAHTFYVTAEQNSGDTWGPVPAGTDVTVSVSDPSTVVSNSCDAEASTGTGDDPRTTTGDAETNVCTVVVNSDDPGTTNVTVTHVSADAAVDSEEGPFEVSDEDLDQGDSTTASKTWVEYQVDIEATATNLTGESHTFYVTVTQDDGTGEVPVPAGTKVRVSDDNDDITPTGTCATGTGDDPRTEEATETNVCTVVVNSDAVDRVTVKVDEVQALAVDDSGDTWATFDHGSLEVATNGSRTATKTWVEVLVDVDPSATNIVGEAHTFDVDVDVITPDTLGTPEGSEPAPNGTIVSFSSTGVGQVVADDGDVDGVTGSTCDEPLSGGTGQCTIVVHSTVSGQRSVSVDSVSFSHGGSNHTVDFADTESAIGKADGQDLTATKTWRAYRVDIEADGFNAVRDPHPFTITIEQTDVADPTESDWGPVPDGTTATVAITSGPGSITSDDCADGGTADDTGTCSVTLNSTVAGTTTVTVSGISVAHPETEATVGVDVSNDSADKTWIAFRGLISRDSVNVIGDDHLFHVNVEYTTDGDDWTQVPDTSTVTVSDNSAAVDSVGGIASDTCGSTVATAASGDVPAHVCTVTVSSGDAGSLEVSVDGVSTADITANGITESFDVTFAGGEDGVLESTQTFPGDDYTATKTWASYTLELPPDAVNLLDGSENDPERFHDVEVRLHSTDGIVAGVGGRDITVTLDGDGRIDAVSAGSVADDTTATCTTGAVTPAAGPQTGTCTVTLFSSAPGQAELHASFTTTLGDSGEVTVTADRDPQTDGDQGHVKTWTTFRVLVDPLDDQNIVGNWHVFTVTVQQSDLQGGWDAVVGASSPDDLAFTVAGSDLTVSTDGSGGAPASTIPYCDHGTNADGKCVVAVNSGTVQAITLTATYTESYTAYNSGTGDAVFDSPQAGKEWIDYAISLTPPSADNLVNTTHTFTVAVGRATAASGGDFLGLPGVTPDVAVLSGPGTISGGTCVTGVTDADGECTIELRSSETGLTTVGASYLGHNASKTESKQLSGTATKLWWDYALDITPAEATNAVGDPHTFTATLTVDTGAGFGPAAGETLQFTVDGVGSVTGGDVTGDLTCTTDGAGRCDIVINSDEGGDTDVGVSYDAEVGGTTATFADAGVKHWVDIDLVKTAVVGDGFGDGDLVADPGTGLPTLFFTTDDQGPKTAVFEYVITNTGGNDLFDLALVDDRLGGIDLATRSDCPDVLAVGESCTARASEQFTYQDAAGGLSNLITNVGVVTASGDDGSEVSDIDDAVIQLIAQQSSILIDLVKGVVSGAGDVDDADGNPTVTWSQDEFEAGASKTVRYRFTITNVGPSPIVDVELTDPMLSGQPLIAVADRVTLQPGESTVVEVDHELTAADAFPDGPTAGAVPNVATVSGANETRDAFDEDVDDAIVFVQVVFSEVEQRKPAVLPATGFGSNGLLPLSLLLVTFGSAMLWLERRRRPTC